MDVVAPLFQYFVQSEKPVPNTEVQASSMTSNKNGDLPTYGGPFIQVHEIYHQDMMISITTEVTLIPLKGNGTVASVFV